MGIRSDAELALVSMGFRKAEAQQAISIALVAVDHDATLEAIVREGLRSLAPKQG